MLVYRVWAFKQCTVGTSCCRIMVLMPAEHFIKYNFPHWSQKIPDALNSSLIFFNGACVYYIQFYLSNSLEIYSGHVQNKLQLTLILSNFNFLIVLETDAAQLIFVMLENILLRAFLPLLMQISCVWHASSCLFSGFYPCPIHKYAVFCEHYEHLLGISCLAIVL